MNRRCSRASRAARTSLGLAVAESLETRRLLAGIVVTTTLDETEANATISLREAAAIADANTEEDTITFDETVFDSGSLHTITILGDIDIVASEKLTIIGPGSDVLALSGDDDARILQFGAGANAELSGMTLTEGRETQGGAIHNAGTLVLREIVFTGNNAIGTVGTDGTDVIPATNGGNAFGGAIFSLGGSLIIDGCSFIDNHAAAGDGGTSSAGAGLGGTAAGGAIHMDNGDIVIDSTTFDANTATGGNAGGNLGDTPVAAGVARGGAVSLVDVTMAGIHGATFTENVATGGDGAAGLANGGSGAVAQGGALNSNVTNFTMDNSSFSNNQAVGGWGDSGVEGGGGGDASGGAVFNVNDASFVDLLFDSNSASAGTAGRGGSAQAGGVARGGAIYNDMQSMTLSSVTLSSNAANGGAGAGGEGSSSDGGSGFGGALYTLGNVAASGVTFSSNIAEGGSASARGGTGGGGAVFSSGSLTLAASTVSGNFAFSGFPGGGMSSASASGGGIFANDGDLTVIDSTIDNNYAYAAGGGEGADGQNGNSGGNAFGGGIFNSTALNISNSTIARNAAIGGNGGAGGAGGNGGDGGEGHGGGIYTTTMGNVIVNATIDSNIAEGGAGGPGEVSGSSGDSNGGNIEAAEQLNPQNTIISRGSAEHGADLFGSFDPENSLITDISFATVGGSDNIIGEDPLLGALTDNGGPTLTMLIDPSSPARNRGDDHLATGAGLEFDQRGVGFTRFAGVVDVGAIELGASIFELSGNGIPIANADDAPSSFDGTAFGAARLGTSIDRTFTITNTGVVDLNLGTIDVPAAFSVLTPFDPVVAPSESTTFTLRFNPGLAGTYSGDVTIAHDQTAGAEYVFTINATALGATMRVNFQPAASEVPTGYLLDAGQVFASRGNGYTYGFNQNITNGAREREADADQRRDTVVHTQLYGSRTWEIAVPNGTYQVHLVAGDPSYFNSVYKINVEGVLTVNGTPTNGNRFIEGTKTVVVSDGRLTITNEAGAVNNKLDYVEITPVVVTSTKINFQTTSSPTPAGYLADSGSIFAARGNGMTYGWNSNASSFARDRNSILSPNQAYDTFIHTQQYGNRSWEIAVANGLYQVRLAAGDASYFDSVYRINVEGVLTVNGTPTSGNRWIEGTQTVLVSDGKLTVTNATGAVNNKFAFIEITPA